VLTGHVTDACHPQHRHQQFPACLRQVARAYLRHELHVVVDNYTTQENTCGARQGGPSSPDHPDRHADLELLAQPRGGILLEPRPPGAARRQFPHYCRPYRRHRPLHQHLERQLRTFHLNRRPDTVLAKATDARHRKAKTASVLQY
jgi:hypothetical protein